MRWVIGRGSILTVIVAVVSPVIVGAQSSSWQAAVDSALGRKGAMQADSSYKFGLPRSDLSVTIGDVTLKPALALG